MKKVSCAQRPSKPVSESIKSAQFLAHVVGFEEGFEGAWRSKTGFRIDQKCAVSGPMWSVLKKVLKALGAEKPVSESIKSAQFLALCGRF